MLPKAAKTQNPRRARWCSNHAAAAAVANYGSAGTLRIPGTVALVGVFSDKPESGALAYARAHALPAEAVLPSDFADREAFDLALMRSVAAARPETPLLLVPSTSNT